MAEAGRRVRSGGGLLPRRGRGVWLLVAFFVQGGRRFTFRVPLRAAPATGLRTVPVQVTVQPDGDVVLALPFAVMEGGGLDARAIDRLSQGLRRLSQRLMAKRPMWGMDALQALGDIGAVMTGTVSGILLLHHGVAEMTPTTLLHAGGTVAALGLPLVHARLRPWLTGVLLPRMIPLVQRKVGKLSKA